MAEAIEREIRVFVSSTFLDLSAERDVLVRRVFPQIRLLCERRGVVFTEIDLRWGLTNEQVAEGQVLPICLDEIRRCRPYFIGILGERYGWVPSELPPELLAQEDWLLPLQGTRSVTELEILFGVLHEAEMTADAFFYFRDLAYLDSERFLVAPSSSATSTYGPPSSNGTSRPPTPGSGRTTACSCISVTGPKPRAAGAPRPPDPSAKRATTLASGPSHDGPSSSSPIPRT